MPATRPETLAFADRAAWSFSATADVGATPEEVFAALADAESWHEWFPLMGGARWTTPAPHGVGSERTVRVGPATVEERFIAWDEGERIAFTFTGANLPIAKAGVEVVELSPSGTGTTVRYTMALEPPGPLGPLRALVAPGVQATLRQALKGLDRYLSG